MFKKLLTMALILAAICIPSTFAYAGGGSTDSNSAIKVESQKIEKDVQINVNSENGIQTEGDVILITIKGKKGITVTLEVYLNTNIKMKENADTIESILESVNVDDFELILSEELELNDNGVYPKEIKLKKGLYKIVATKKGDSGYHRDVRYVLCKGIDNATKTLDDAKNSIVSPVIDAIKKLINSK